MEDRTEVRGATVLDQEGLVALLLLAAASCATRLHSHLALSSGQTENNGITTHQSVKHPLVLLRPVTETKRLLLQLSHRKVTFESLLKQHKASETLTRLKVVLPSSYRKKIQSTFSFRPWQVFLYPTSIAT